MTGPNRTTGTAGCTRVNRSSQGESNIGGEAFNSSVRRMREP